MRSIILRFDKVTAKHFCRCAIYYIVIRDFIFLVLFFVLLGVWVTGWLAFHVAGGLIHLLLIVAVISLVLHLFRGTRSV
jgi:hypothetical protein